MKVFFIGFVVFFGVLLKMLFIILEVEIVGIIIKFRLNFNSDY